MRRTSRSTIPPLLMITLIWSRLTRSLGTCPSRPEEARPRARRKRSSLVLSTPIRISLKSLRSRSPSGWSPSAAFRLHLHLLFLRELPLSAFLSLLLGPTTAEMSLLIRRLSRSIDSWVNLVQLPRRMVQGRLPAERRVKEWRWLGSS